MKKKNIFVRLLRGNIMGKRIKNFVIALSNLVSGDDYLHYITDGKMSRKFIGKYQGSLNDKTNMNHDMRNVHSDMKCAINAGYGKVATKQ